MSNKSSFITATKEYPFARYRAIKKYCKFLGVHVFIVAWDELYVKCGIEEDGYVKFREQEGLYKKLAGKHLQHACLNKHSAGYLFQRQSVASIQEIRRDNDY